jgi:aspartyl aminopeptidase
MAKKEEKGKYDKLFLEQKSAWAQMSKSEIKKAFDLSEEYKGFLNANKTERDIVEFVEKLAKKKGFVELKNATPKTRKIYAINHKKNILLFDLGKDGIEKGLRIIGSHVDAVRLDLKLNPIYEAEPFALINLHYYGGIKKYHWLNIPMTLNGVVIDKSGKEIKINIGNKENEPVFVISDLLPHLEGEEGRTKKATDIIKGEQMDAIGASIPVEDKKTKEKVKATFLDALNKKYGLTEADFITADLSLYPALKTRDVGIDSGMIGGPAHDDRVCSFLAVKSIFDSKSEKTKVVLLVDKEEIGSVGNTSMSSMFFENTLKKIVDLQKKKARVSIILEKSCALSGDVTSGLDPKYADKMDPHNVNKPGYGISVEKGTGYGGKYAGSEASAEYIAWIKKLLDKAKVPWQYGEMGKVDQGGGGTIAQFLAKYNMDIVDAGPPVLAMHSPFEIVSKADVYATYNAYKAFLESK